MSDKDEERLPIDFMQFKAPKNTDKYFWTKHAAFKLRLYGLSAQRIIRVISDPQRREDGIAEKTVAVMQPASMKNKNGKKVWSQEIWAMYQISADDGKVQNESGNTRYKIISVWRYPGVSPEKNPIPREILDEI
jgi:hypothetical protein